MNITQTPIWQALQQHQQQTADVQKVEGMLEHWEHMLVELGLMNPEIPTEMMARVRALFARTQLTHNEVNFLRGIARAVIEGKSPGKRHVSDK